MLGLGKNSLFNGGLEYGAGVDSVKTFCNALTAELLAPATEFKKSWVGPEGIDKLAKKFSCSSFVIARRALDNGYISRSEYEEITNAALERFREYQANKSGGGNYYRNIAFQLDRRFVTMLLGSVRAGSTSYTDAFRLTNTNYKTFSKLTDYLEGNAT